MAITCIAHSPLLLPSNAYSFSCDSSLPVRLFCRPLYQSFQFTVSILVIILDFLCSQPCSTAFLKPPTQVGSYSYDLTRFSMCLHGRSLSYPNIIALSVIYRSEKPFGICFSEDIIPKYLNMLRPPPCICSLCSGYFRSSFTSGFLFATGRDFSYHCIIAIADGIMFPAMFH